MIEADVVRRIDRLNQEKADLLLDISAVYQEAKSSGFATKIIRELIKRRAKSPSEIGEAEALLEIYQRAVDGTVVDEGRVVDDTEGV